MIPTYNHQQYIIRAIESALSQDYENLEIVVSDDSSTDDTQAVVRGFIEKSGDSRIKYFRNHDNLGILKNYRKTLYDYAEGDWVINLDGDDFFIDPKYISTAIKLTKEDDNIFLVFGNACEFYQKTSNFIYILNKGMPRIMEAENFLLRFSTDGIFLNHSSILYKRSQALEVGFYWDDIVPRNDWDSFLRLIINNRVGFIENIASAWVQHGSNETRRTDIKKYINNFDLINGVCLFAKKNGYEESFVRRFSVNMFYKYARDCSIAYIKNRDFRGLALYLSYAYREDWLLPIKVIFNPGIIARFFLAFNPSLYAIVKKVTRKLSFH
jgi:glycosyltransferase involved in cell wall biosynthesis